jgi:hypothetical protein
LFGLVTLALASATTEKASLTSQKSTSLASTPANFSALGMASDGLVQTFPKTFRNEFRNGNWKLGGRGRIYEVVKSMGACSASAKPRILARGLSPSARAFSSLISSSADAPSFSEDAFAAVTVP